jgi:hypothetical protein
MGGAARSPAATAKGATPATSLRGPAASAATHHHGVVLPQHLAQLPEALPPRLRRLQVDVECEQLPPLPATLRWLSLPQTIRLLPDTLPACLQELSFHGYRDMTTHLPALPPALRVLCVTELQQLPAEGLPPGLLEFHKRRANRARGAEVVPALPSGLQVLCYQWSGSIHLPSLCAALAPLQALHRLHLSDVECKAAMKLGRQARCQVRSQT